MTGRPSPTDAMPPPGYRITDGRVRNPRGCEINAVLHCNLRCRGCSHLSPVMPAWFVEPERVARDLSALATAYSCAFVKILGGEPLLHPGLPDVVEAVRSSGITDHVAVATNGLLLNSAGARLWSLVDEFKVSVYPGSAPAPEDLRELRRRAEDHGVRLDVKLVPVFREPYARLGTEDPRLIDRIFRTCEIAHV